MAKQAVCKAGLGNPGPGRGRGGCPGRAGTEDAAEAAAEAEAETEAEAAAWAGAARPVGAAEAEAEAAAWAGAARPVRAGRRRTTSQKTPQDSAGNDFCCPNNGTSCFGTTSSARTPS